jgi:hypothetical protein
MKLKYIATVAFAVAMASCNILDKEPSDSWDSGSAIQTIDDLKYAVNGVYESQTSSIDKGKNPFGSYAGDFGLFGDLKGSDYKCVGYNNQATDISQYKATATSSMPENIYKRFYLSIARINKILEQIAASGLSGEEVEVCKGELYALRALFHFDLARVYAQLPTVANKKGQLDASDMGIVLSTQTYNETFVPKRATLKETYEAILADIKTALDIMTPITGLGSGKPDTRNPNTSKGHMNYWSTLALRARVNLYLDNLNIGGTTEHNEQALKDAEEIINSNKYKLYNLADYTSVWTKEFTDESIFEIQVTSLYNPQRNSLGYYTSPEGYAEAAMSDSFVSEFIGEESSYKYKNTDIRVSADMIAKKADSYGDNEAYYTQKYPGRDGQIYVNNPKVFRLSEIYLIAAEAALKTNNNPKAAKYIDDLRLHRIEGYVEGSTTAVTIDDILTERRLELNGEGHMAWDMWRNEKSVNNPKVGEVKPGADNAVFPIPQANINVAHGALKQNPGF